MAHSFKIQPSLETVKEVLRDIYTESSSRLPNIVPVCATIPADILTPSLAYLKVCASTDSDYSFLFESAATSETIGRYSFIGANPAKVLKTGPGHGTEADPLPFLEQELSHFREAVIPHLSLPPLTGGAIGYVGYDCVRYFEPRTARKMKDVLQVPESLFMLFNTIVAFDHFFQVVKVVTYLHLPQSINTPEKTLASAYQSASETLTKLVATLQSPNIPEPPQKPITPNHTFTSNIGQSGYEAHVKTLKREIQKGSIIQCVPSHRISRPTDLHPFNVYRQLRTTNPSPYLFYISCSDFQLVGASPELLITKDPQSSRIITHPIAGTVKRGRTVAEDEALANTLRASLKDRAEHVMLVDLARNDINRVCDPTSTRVDRLMVVEKFSHVQHLVSQVSGLLRRGQTRFDAFRSIFPAGTVSGAPKVRAMELIAELEKEKRGVYAGAVGYFGFGKCAGKGNGIGNGQNDSSGAAGVDGIDEEGAMDTCIALRTMLLKDGVAYLQAGGGIVWDSDPEDEWIETMNKLAANIRCVEAAEERYGGVVSNGDDAAAAVINGSGHGHGGGDVVGGQKNGEKLKGGEGARQGKVHVDIAAAG